MNYEQMGKFISSKRKEKNMTQKELALKIGVTDKAVSKWERGLGCPDVSILEILSNELGVSILEILKGRIIENEVIKVTELNDYVKETIDYSKNKRKELINKIIIFLISMTCIALILLNVIQYTHSNLKYEIGNFYMDDIIKKIDSIEETSNLILNNQGIYSDDDYKEIVKTIREYDKQLSKVKTIKLDNIKLNDLYILSLYTPRGINNVDVLTILEKYDSSIKNYKDLYIKSYISSAYSETNIYKEVMSSYQYRLVNIPNELMVDYNVSNLNLGNRMYSIFYKIEQYSYLLENIKRIGEIHE